MCFCQNVIGVLFLSQLVCTIRLMNAYPEEVMEFAHVFYLELLCKELLGFLDNLDLFGCYENVVDVDRHKNQTPADFTDVETLIGSRLKKLLVDQLLM